MNHAYHEGISKLILGRAKLLLSRVFPRFRLGGSLALPVLKPLHVTTSATKRRLPRRRPRKGLTLFEVLLALAIFLVSLAALAHLITNGTRAAVQGRLQTEAIIRCKSKMAEVVAGAEAMETLSQVAFPDNPKWLWGLSVEQGPWPDLRTVQVTVSHVGTNPLGNTSYTLQCYVRDPRLLDQEEVYTPVEVTPLRNAPLPDIGPNPSEPEDTDG